MCVPVTGTHRTGTNWYKLMYRFGTGVPLSIWINFNSLHSWHQVGERLIEYKVQMWEGCAKIDI